MGSSTFLLQMIHNRDYFISRWVIYMSFYQQLQDRGLIAQQTHPELLKEAVDEKKLTLYCGFDPTADSLHVGSLMPLLNLVRFQRAGHRVLFLVGGGTGLVGDPSGKTSMRKMLAEEQLLQNCDSLRGQVSQYLNFEDPQKGLFVNNIDWLRDLHYLEVLRDIGPHFSVNRMLTAECFKQRLESGLSFLEFNYMILQSYDFLYLHKKYGCSLQIGGDDQWSNILAGMELIRRLSEGAQAFCMTFPLLTTSDGKKMGKTEKGAVWLDPHKTSPYEFYQYWRNVEDAVALKCLRFFTFLTGDEIAPFERLEGSEINQTKEKLAEEVTSLIHGPDEAKRARSNAKSFFGGGNLAGVEATSLAETCFGLANQLSLLDILVLTEIVPSKAEAKRLVQQGGIRINNLKIVDLQHKVSKKDLAGAEDFVIKKGKKNYYKVKLTQDLTQQLKRKNVER